MTSKAINELSMMDLPSTKADCSSERHLDKQPFNLLANNFETTLYTMLQSEIRRKSFILVGLSHFGMRHIFVSLRLIGKKPRSNQCETAPKIPTSQMFQN